MSSTSSESSTEKLEPHNESNVVEAVSESPSNDAIRTIDLTKYELGRSLLSIPFHPFLHHALRRKGVEIATRTQLAFFALHRAHEQLYFPLNRGGGRFVALCLMVLNRALRGDRFLIVASNKILRRYVSSDLESLGGFCPLDIVVYNHVHEKMKESVQQSHIVVTPMEGLQETLKDTDFSFSEVIVVEPELHRSEEISGLLERSQTTKLLGLYQKTDRLDEQTHSIFPDLLQIAYVSSQKSKTLYWFSNEHPLEMIQRILLYVNTPMMLVCANEEQAQKAYASLIQSCSLILYLPATSLRRNKEQAYRLLASKKIQLVVVAQSEFSKKTRHPVIFLDVEPTNIEHDGYWLSSDRPEDKEELQECTLPSLAVLQEKCRNDMIHELEKSTFVPPAQDVESLYSAICERPELLKAVIRDSLQYQSNKMFEQQQEAMRIEEKEAFARKETWKGGNKRRKRRR